MRPQPDAALISRQAVDVIENTLAPEMQQAMGTLTALRYREKPRPFAELYLSPAGKPRATVRVRRDGTIRVTRQGHDDQRTWPGDLPGKVAREIHSEIAAELTIRALRRVAPRRLGPAACAIILDEPQTAAQLRKAADKAARDIFRNSMTQIVLNGKETSLGRKRPEDMVEYAITEIIAPDITRLATRLNCAIFLPHPTLSMYNKVVRNRKTVETMMRDSENIIRCHHICLSPNDQEDMGTPEQVTREVRELLQLTPVEWKLFCRTGWHYKHQEGQHDPAETANAIRLGFKALGEANQPQAPIDTLWVIAGMTHCHQTFRQMPWNHGDPWTAWVHVINQALDTAGRDSVRASRFHITHVAEALLWHVENQEPWGPSSWEGYRRRSDNWHLRIIAGLGREQDRQARWTSMLDETRIGQFELSPVTTGDRLIELGAQMQNCLGAYVRQCVLGNTRIFTLTQDGELKAAGQLIRLQEGWSAGQVEAPGHQPPGTNARRAMEQAAQLYQAAQDAQLNPGMPS